MSLIFMVKLMYSQYILIEIELGSVINLKASIVIAVMEAGVALSIDIVVSTFTIVATIAI